MAETPAETIRRAANMARGRAVVATLSTAEFLLALSALLEREAALIEAQVFPQSDPDMERIPLNVARAYLGET